MRPGVRAGLGALALVALGGSPGCRKPSATDSQGSDAGSSSSASALEDAGPMTANSVPPEDVAKFVNPQGLPAYGGPVGSVEGTIRVVGDPPADLQIPFGSCAGAPAIWGKQFREGAASDDGSRPLADALVAVTGYQGYFVPERDEAEAVTIDGCGFRRTITLTFGQRIEVKNTSKEFWTPRLEPTPNKVMMMAPPGGDPVRIYPKRPGRFFLTDHDRKYAVADVFVMLHPLHAATDTAGHYRIDGVPVGKLQVNAMHPRIAGETSADVTIEPNVVAKVDLVLRHTAVDASAPAPGPSGRPRMH